MTARFQQQALLLDQQWKRWWAQQQALFWRDQSEKQQFMEKWVQELMKETPDQLRSLLVDDDPILRWVAVQVIGQRRLPMEVDLIDLLSDKRVEVREVARQGLVRLSRGCDFGPLPQATAEQRLQSLAAWRRWWALQDPPLASSLADSNKVIP